jgi:hypothetical protein
MRGGTRRTLDFSRRHGMPVLVVDAVDETPVEAAGIVLRFIEERRVHTLNAAGPTRQRLASGHVYSRDTLAAVLRALPPPGPDQTRRSEGWPPGGRADRTTGYLRSSSASTGTGAEIA